MRDFVEQMTQQLAIPIASLPPSNVSFSNTVPQTIGPIDMSKFRRAFGHVVAGVIAATGNVAIYFQGSNSSNTGFANIASFPTVFLTTSNTEGTVELRADQLPVGNRYVQLCVLDQVANAFLSATCYGGHSEYGPTSQYNLTNTTVLQQGVL